MRARYLSIGLAMVFAAGLRADVTIRYQSDLKPAAGLQPLLQQVFQAAQTNNSGSSIKMKGNRAYTTSGTRIEIFDFVKQEVTMIDTAQKTYATLPLAKLTDAFASAMPTANPKQAQAVEQIMSQIKTSAETKITGRTDTIQGVEAQERELTLTMEMPMPGSKESAGPAMRLVMQIWTAKPGEALRNPAIRELTGLAQWQRYVLDPAGMLEKVTSKMPGMADSLRPMLEALFKEQSVILRAHMEMYMPFLATMSKQVEAQGQNNPLAGIDPNAPLMEMNQEVAELSSDPVDGSIFDIPKDYQTVAADDMIKQMIEARAVSTPGVGGK